jgi:hypothetical protein
MLSHQAIKHHFGTDQGVYLQGIEGDLAITILDAAIEIDLPLINIHDAYLVPANRLAEFDILFARCLRRVVGKEATLQLEIKTQQPLARATPPSPSPDPTPTSPYKAVTQPAMTQCVNNPYISPPVIAVRCPNKLLCHSELERAGADLDDPLIDWTRMDF